MSKYAVTIDGHSYELNFDLPLQRGREFFVSVGDETLRVRIPPTDGIDWMIINDRPYEVHFDGNPHVLQGKSDIHPVEVHDRDTSRDATPERRWADQSADSRHDRARCWSKPVQQVEIGQPILILEAMKMENEIRAPRGGQIGTVHIAVGRIVTRGELLVEVI